MIIADVLIGKYKGVRRYFYCPRDGYDTIVSYNNNEYVKFYDIEFYPKYVVYYNNIVIRKLFVSGNAVSKQFPTLNYRCTIIILHNKIYE